MRVVSIWDITPTSSFEVGRFCVFLLFSLGDERRRRRRGDCVRLTL